MSNLQASDSDKVTKNCYLENINRSIDSNLKWLDEHPRVDKVVMLGAVIKHIEKQVAELGGHHQRRFDEALASEVGYLRGEIDKVPALMVYGNWDYKRCLFCKGKRGHEPGCIKGTE
jgi:hypothetical protein